MKTLKYLALAPCENGWIITRGKDRQDVLEAFEQSVATTADQVAVIAANHVTLWEKEKAKLEYEQSQAQK